MNTDLSVQSIIGATESRRDGGRTAVAAELVEVELMQKGLVARESGDTCLKEPAIINHTCLRCILAADLNLRGLLVDLSCKWGKTMPGLS